MRRRALAIFAVVVGGAVAAAPAAADSRTVRDVRGDTKGSHYPGAPYAWSSAHGCWITPAYPECGETDYFENAGPRLDIASISHGHSGKLLVHRVAMGRNWRNSLLDAGHRGQISLYFNLDRDAAFERRLDLYLRRGKLAGVVRAGSRRVASVAVTRPNAKTVEMRFARTSLGAGGLTYGWFAFAGIACKRQYDRCGDRAPSPALLSHRLP